MKFTNSPFPSTKKGKKFSVYAFDGKRKRLIHFGAKGYSDYTKHGDNDRKKRYIARHQANETWTAKGILTAGFWSRWVLWNRVTLESSIEDVQNRFGLIVKEL